MFRNRFLSLFRYVRDGRAQPAGVAMAWYPEEQWALLRQVSADADRLEQTYAQWLKVAEARYEVLVQKGTRVEKIPVDVADMAVWCREMGRPVDATGRAAYAAYRQQDPANPHKPLGQPKKFL